MVNPFERVLSRALSLPAALHLVGHLPYYRLNNYPPPMMTPSWCKAIPYGVYDLAADTGWVGVGTDHDTAAFAVATIARWWDAVGQTAYPVRPSCSSPPTAAGQTAPEPACENRAGRTSRPHRPDDHRLPPTPWHLQMEHDRTPALSHISMNWRGRPLTSHEVIVET